LVLNMAQIRVVTIGKSYLGQPLTGLEFGEGKNCFMLTSGMHGDEVEGVIFGTMLWSALSNAPISKRWRLV